MLIRICLALLLLCEGASALELKGKKFDDTMKVDGVDLKVNPLGIRRVRKFAIPIKVYVMVFYLRKKTTEREAMKKVEPPIFIRMVWLLSVNKKKLVDGWNEAFEKNCGSD